MRECIVNSTLVPFLMIGLFAAGIGLVVWAAARQGRRTTENVRELAGQLGLEFSAGEPVLGVFYPAARATGQIRGKRVELFSFATGSGKSRVQWCAVSAAVAGAGGLTFHLRRQGFGTKFMALFGAKEISVGDPEFDRAWFIQTNQPEYFRAALLPELREKISALVREPGRPARGIEFKLEAAVVRYAEMGTFASADSCRRCRRAAEIVCDLADLAEVWVERKP
jgi:hypothetical protein